MAGALRWLLDFIGYPVGAEPAVVTPAKVVFRASISPLFRAEKLTVGRALPWPVFNAKRGT